MRDRVTFPQDFWQHGRYFFFSPETYDQAVIAKRWNDDAIRVFSAYRDEVAALPSIDADSARATLESAALKLGVPVGKVLQALRVVITGVGGGPDLMIIMEIIGKNEVVKRIDRALKTLGTKVS